MKTNKEIETILVTALATANLPQALQEVILPYLSIDAAIKEISPRGKGTKVKTNKPKDKIWAYVWRQARFDCGDDVTLPMLAGWDLSSAIDPLLPVVKYDWQTQTYTQGSEEQRTANAKAYNATSEILCALASIVVTKMGLNPDKGVNRWRQAIYG